jgi:hypothetical protein
MAGAPEAVWRFAAYGTHEQPEKAAKSKTNLNGSSY